MKDTQPKDIEITPLYKKPTFVSIGLSPQNTYNEKNKKTKMVERYFR